MLIVLLMIADSIALPLERNCTTMFNGIRPDQANWAVRSELLISERILRNPLYRQGLFLLRRTVRRLPADYFCVTMVLRGVAPAQ